MHLKQDFLPLPVFAAVVPLNQHLTERELPLTKNLRQTMQRVLPFWHESIMPSIRKYEKVIIAAHGNSLRALLNYIDNLTDDEVNDLDLPTARLWVVELDDQLNSVRHHYLQ